MTMELSTIIQRYQRPFLNQYAARLQPKHRHAIHAVLACRTEHYGEMLLHCQACESSLSLFHSCGHRSCPRCQNYDTTRWLERQQQKLLPVEYFMVTFTLPYELRNLAWSHQKMLYTLLFECAVSTLKDFGMNEKMLQGDLGMTAVLHTHTRRLDFHPHLHVVIPGGCIQRKRKQWKKLKGRYLFNEFALASVFRGRFLAAMNKAGMTPPKTPPKWVVDCEHVGRGLPALQYLSRYLYRGVISEKNILSDDGTYVTFQYRENQTKTLKTRTVKGEVFLWLVFQHVLPKGFRRVRDFGFLHGNAKKLRRLVQMILKVIITLQERKPRPCYRCALCGMPMVLAKNTFRSNE
jgi:hypothetical protein